MIFAKIFLKILFLKASLAYDENAKKVDVPINPACGKEWDIRFLLLSPQPLLPEVVKCVRLYAARTPKWCWYATFLVYYGTLSGKLFHTGLQLGAKQKMGFEPFLWKLLESKELVER